MSHLFTVTIVDPQNWPSVSYIEKVLDRYGRRYVGSESYLNSWKFKWVIEKFPPVDDEFMTFLAIQIGHKFVITDWEW